MVATNLFNPGSAGTSFNPAPLGPDFSSGAINYTPGGGSSSGGGGFFGNFKFSDLMPVAAAGLGGLFAGRTADNYGRSMLAAQQLTADAALGTAMINANLEKDSTTEFAVSTLCSFSRFVSNTRKHG